jgi:hypothetical protein
MKIKGLKIILFFCLLIAAFQIDSQAQTGTWKTYMAYQNATIVAETPHLVFAVYDGSLVSYNPEDEEVRTYTNQQGLHDVDIQYMVYSPGANALVLVYANANIDIFMKAGDVYNLSFIKDNTFLRDKTVYNLEMIGDYAYLSTAFGIVVVDVKRKEIKDTYSLGAETKSVSRRGDYLYAATVDGIKKAAVSSNLLDKDNWITFDETTSSEYLSSVTKMLIFKDRLVYLQWGDAFYLTENGEVAYLTNGPISQMTVLNDQLILLRSTDILFYTDFEKVTNIPITAHSIDCRNAKNHYWLGLGESGLTGITKQTGSSEYNLVTSEIKIDSPKRNLNFFMKYVNNKLLIVGGGRGADRNNTPGTFMVREDNKWYNFDEKAISEKTGLACSDFMSVEVDPANPNHYFVASWGEGLYEFEDNEFVKLYSYKNSSLQTALPDFKPDNFVRVDGLAFDNQNNLYMVNGGVPNGLSVFMDQKEWKNTYFPPLASSDPNKILISKDNLKWLNFWRGERSGIMVIDDKNTVSDVSDDQYAYSNRFVDQQGNDIGATAYLCMAEDLNENTIWVGTDNGLISFSSAAQVGRGECYRVVSSDSYGENFYLLEGLRITSIAIDGGNRKWIGTDGSGVFVVNQSTGTNAIQVENYTTENSYLISDRINSIAINQETGEVFIGTDKGLCSYMGEAITGKSDYSNVYAMPNPVRPATDNQVLITGLMQNSTVKITDITGHLIQEGKSLGGQYIWNCRDRRGAIVKAGIYLVFAATPDGGQGVVSKMMVIK